MKEEKLIISFFIPSLQGGGAERVVVNLANGLSDKGYTVHIVVLDKSGPFLKEVSNRCQVVDLKIEKARKSIRSIYRYIRDANPYIVISNSDYFNVIVLLASFFVKTKTKYITIEHNVLSKVSLFSDKRLSSKLVPFLMYLTYWRLNKVVAVSEGVKKSIIRMMPYLKSRVTVIYNPIFSEDILLKKYEKIEEYIINQWIEDKKPIIISAGRLTFEKDYSTLVKAFDIVRKKGIDAKLIILGEGEDRGLLEKMVKELGIAPHVFMPGFKDNPYKYMRNSNVFVLSSIYEGFSNVIIEALACGVPVVSTDCDSGPSEILDNGKYGRLVPVGNAEKMAEAIIETFNSEYDSNVGIQRAKEFSVDNAINKYVELIENV